MCGIFGYVNYCKNRTRREILNLLIDGLQRVEYRGYDSAGLCVDSSDKGRFPTLIKSVGNILTLRNLVFTEESNTDEGLNVSFDTHVAIGHTRWATHGTPSLLNCHPQSSNNKMFFIVHNGIINNFIFIKQMLLEKGYHFDSETDTEVIAVFAEYLYDQNRTITFVELMIKVTEMLEGAYAILIKSSFFPDEVVACRKCSPLMIGVSRKTTTTLCEDEKEFYTPQFVEVFFASDMNSFIEHTKEVIFLEDGDIAHFKKGLLFFYNIVTNVTTTNNDNNKKIKSSNTNDSCNVSNDTNSFKYNSFCKDKLIVNNDRCIVTVVDRMPQIVDCTIDSASKNGYDSFMLKEICEQPDSVARSMQKCINFSKGDIYFDGIDSNAITKFLKARRLILISCGTSYHSCLAVRPIFEELLPKTFLVVENALSFNDRHPNVFHDDLCVFVSQSGETADTLMALHLCKTHGATLVGVTNVQNSSLQRLVDYAIPLNAGVEIGVASTKAYTSQVVVLTVFALLLSNETNSDCDDDNSDNNNNNNNNNIDGDCVDQQLEDTPIMKVEREMNKKKLRARRAEIINGMAALPGAIAQCLQNVYKPVMSLAEMWRDAASFLVLGRGYDHATALESALKLKELTYIFTEGIHAGELKHGPLALVDEDTHVIVFCSHDRHFESTKNAIQQVKARGGCIATVTTKKDTEVLDSAMMCIEVPAVVDCLQGIINIVPLQLLAYRVALLRGYNVDCPRNLAKSVTVE